MNFSMNRRDFIQQIILGSAALSASTMLSGHEMSLGMLIAKDGKILSPAGSPINLCGYRIAIGDAVKNDRYSLRKMGEIAAEGLLGNCSAVEIWFGNDNDWSPGERSVLTPGEYNEEQVAPLIAFMKDLVKAGSYVIPSLRVSYDGAASKYNTENGTKGRAARTEDRPQGRPGWCDHLSLINNDPVVVTMGPNAGTYGRHRDRYLAWIDWLMPQILADKELADGIAYWEIWHYPGHRHNLGQYGTDKLIDEAVPAILEVVRKHDPKRMVGIPLVNNEAVNKMNERLQGNPSNAFPWKNDPNWVMVTGGYGRLGIIMRPDLFDIRKTNWPTDSKNPEWLGDAVSGEFNVTRLARLCAPYALHSQEGPGLRETFRINPIPEPQRTWLWGLLNFYNETTNGFGFHAWPPSWANLVHYRFGKPEGFDETEFLDVMRKALKGEQV